MSGNSEIERFQRWLQSELSLASDIEDPLERDRRQTQLEIAISEALRFRETLESIGGSVAAPFVERESPVRKPTNIEVKPSVALGECHSCGAKMSGDIEFCPVCGEF
ncbi:MAG TPA: hypothetical protein QF641_03990 [Candidatus Thalassarchaeaceae archaeon]|jgi:hypothetical protein|nr:hypothetical protein [Candidatus Thalassarchaeaceae archaeon]|tara:strand:+ start:42812 stop:43132 length:321 start_codon:yes stop_codon:yes gene_type:complete